MKQGEGWPQVQTGVLALQRRVRSHDFWTPILSLGESSLKRSAILRLKGHKTLDLLEERFTRPLVGIKLSQDHALLILQRGVFCVVDLGRKRLVKEPL